MTTWICELTRSDVQMMAALVHNYLTADPEHALANKLLDKLIEQTEGVVTRDPLKHPLQTMPDRPEVEYFQPVLTPYYPGTLFDE